MASGILNPKVDKFLSRSSQWQDEFEKLRMIIMDCGLTEDFKWGNPCYTDQKSNIVLIHGFKEYCALLFFKGVLMKDPQGILIQQTENVQSARQIRFTNISEIEALEQDLKAYVKEAVRVEHSGAAVPFKTSTEFPVPDELKTKFEEVPKLKTAFEALTPGRQRAYLLHFADPKQSKTRVARIEKYMPHILEGKGLND